jgi:hypothetical protein
VVEDGIGWMSGTRERHAESIDSHLAAFRQSDAEGMDMELGGFLLVGGQEVGRINAKLGANISFVGCREPNDKGKGRFGFFCI